MKRLVVCCDGTWNELSRYPTNVAKLAQSVKPFAQTTDSHEKIAQIVYYQPGLGTKWYDRIPGGAFGWGIDYNIQQAYEFLCFNYEPGDEIYLFGFSRGAYTARSLAGMIYCSGLLKRNWIGKIEQAYALYRDRHDETKPSRKLATDFRSSYGVHIDGDNQIPITLLGCWDTVGSLGIPNLSHLLPLNEVINQRYRFHDHQLNRKIQTALHAVAIDERRKVFDVTPMEKSPNNRHQIVRQVWFPGGHGCVGGGTPQHRGLSDNALRWIVESIADLKLGLEFNPLNDQMIDPTIDFDATPGMFGLAGLHDRPISPDFWVLHESVKQRWLRRKDYRPENLQPFASQLNTARTPLVFPVPELQRVA